MLDRSIDLLNVRPGLTYVDATAGGGGHFNRILDLLKGTGQLIAVDQDLRCIEHLRDRYQESRISLIHANFANLSSELKNIGVNTITGGIIADLGVSSMQLDDSARGFSITRDGPLDMRMNPCQKLSAHDLINHLDEETLADIIFNYGEERHSRAIARNIVWARPIKSTSELAEVVSRAIRRRQGNKKRSRRDTGAASVISHPATRTFQAIRIAVNAELDSLKIFLEQAGELLAPGARLVVITFHSLEDRLVKEFFRREAANCICPPRQPLCTCDKKPRFLIITRKPFVPEEEEVLANVRSRSAKLRAGEKLS